MTEPASPELTALIEPARRLRERFLADDQRPGYHFALPEDLGVPGDPNGAFYANGRYHLMYLYNRRGVGFCWGHVSSADLLHWRHHPDALGPGAGDEGCFSGGAFVDEDGTAYLTYWRLWGEQGIGLARSADPDYDHWEKWPVSAIPATRFGVLETTDDAGRPLILACADPSNIWKKDGAYYFQTGNLVVLNEFGRGAQHPRHAELRGDWVDLFRSTDLKQWAYVHRFYDRDAADRWTDGSEDDMCPSFLPLPASAEGGPPSGKHLQLFIAHNRGCQYYVGTYDQAADKFRPEQHGRMSWVDNTFFAPEALVDGQGRQIMWAWLLDNPGDEQAELARGWSGVYGLPRLLWLGEDGTLRLRVPPEFERLRRNPRQWSGLAVAAESRVALAGVNGRSCELWVEWTPQPGRQAGLVVRASPDGAESTRLYYEPAEASLVFDARQSSAAGVGRPVLEKAPLALAPGERLSLRVFIDQTVIEVFANDRQAITRRVYPTRPESTGVYLFSEGGETVFDTAAAWELMACNPY